MSTQLELMPGATPALGRSTMNGKPVFTVPAKSVLNLESGFSHKLLCDGPTFSTGSACTYRCAFCYVPAIMAKSPHMEPVREYNKALNVPGATPGTATGTVALPLKHEDVVIRRSGAVEALGSQLVDRHGAPKYKTLGDTRVIYSSPLVDVAGNMELVRETVECCRLLLELTNWHIRLLSKSNLLPKVAEGLEERAGARARARVIYGVSTGTLDDRLAAAFEEDTPKVSKRIQSLHWLQDNGFRTYGMVCPSLPLADGKYDDWAREVAAAIRADRCEHVWAEVLNVRGDSMTRTVNALRAGGFDKEASLLEDTVKDAWECYARSTFEAHAKCYAPGKLRFLQYVTNETRAWWKSRERIGAVLLGAHSA